MRDLRWERVQGGMTRWTYPGDDEPTGVRVEIEVVTPSGHRVAQNIIVTDDVRRYAAVDPMPAVLDQMVRKLDEAIHA